MSDLPDRERFREALARHRGKPSGPIEEAWLAGDLKSRDEMDEAKAMWALMYYRDKVTVPYELPGKILDAAWGEVADE